MQYHHTKRARARRQKQSIRADKCTIMCYASRNNTYIISPGHAFAAHAYSHSLNIHHTCENRSLMIIRDYCALQAAHVMYVYVHNTLK